MSDNPLKIYKDYVRANLPTGMSYNTDVDRYQLNDHSFFKYVPANWYLRYISKYGYSAAPALSVYAVNELEPSYVTDFGAEFYRKSGATSTFSDSITHSAASNGTMVDSDGLLKWRPHNLLLRSDDLTVSPWVNDGTTDSLGGGTGLAATLVTQDTSTQRHLIYQQVLGASLAAHTVVFYVKDNGQRFVQITFGSASVNNAGYSNFDLTLETSNDSSGYSSTITNVGDGVYRITSTTTLDAAQPYLVLGLVTSLSSPQSESFTGDGVSGVYVGGAHLYRSDLGGMVNNPDQPAGLETYVPTTTSAVYLPRRGHHVYNGDSWVNKGLLHESELRVNFSLNSGNYSTGWSVENAAVGATKTLKGVPLTEIIASGGLTLRVLNISPQTTSGPVTASIFVENVSIGQIKLGFSTSSSHAAVYHFDTQTWSSVGSEVVDYGVEDYGDGLFRVWVVSDGVSTSNRVDIRTQVVPAAGETFFIGADQLEEGSTPSSYIPTNGQQVTRDAETLTVPAANLPWPSPVVIGEELVTNGTFDTDTSGWSSSGSITLASVSGQGVFTSAQTVAYGYQAVTTEAGKLYRITFDYVSSTGGNLYFRVGSGVGLNNLVSVNNSSGYGSREYLFVATSTLSYVHFGCISGASITVDNISVKEINPLSVSIQMQGEMTYADEGVATTATPFRWFNSSINYIDVNVSTFSTDNGKLDFRQNYQGVLDKATSSLTAYPAGVNVPFNIASRHGSTFINGAVDGTALTADTTPVALPDLSATDLQLGYDFNGTISLFRIWADDLTDAGIAEASITNPLVVGKPTISGDETVGAVLTATEAFVIGTPTPTTTWQWNRNGAAISGATSSTYTLVGDDVGATITVTQTETNAGGSDSATSDPTGTISAVPAGAIQQRDGGYILDRAGDYIEVRA